MNQVALIWVALLVGAAVSGASIVGVLVVRREMELAAALLGVAGFGIAAFAFAEIFQIYSRPDAALWALAFMVAAGGGGYALASTLLYRYSTLATEPVLPDELPPDPGTPAVILVASVESRSYDPRETAKMLQSLAEEDLLDASIGVLPFLFFAQKARYRVIADNSPAASELRAVSDRLAQAVSDSNVSVDWAGSSAADYGHRFGGGGGGARAPTDRDRRAVRGRARAAGARPLGDRFASATDTRRRGALHWRTERRGRNPVDARRVGSCTPPTPTPVWFS